MRAFSPPLEINITSIRATLSEVQYLVDTAPRHLPRHDIFPGPLHTTNLILAFVSDLASGVVSGSGNGRLLLLACGEDGLGSVSFGGLFAVRYIALIYLVILH